MTQGISLMKVMAPVMWYRTLTSRICSHGIGMFSSSFITACGMYFSALNNTTVEWRNTLHSLTSEHLYHQRKINLTVWYKLIYTADLVTKLFHHQPVLQYFQKWTYCSKQTTENVSMLQDVASPGPLPIQWVCFQKYSGKVTRIIRLVKYSDKKTVSPFTCQLNCTQMVHQLSASVSFAKETQVSNLLGIFSRSTSTHSRQYSLIALNLKCHIIAAKNVTTVDSNFITQTCHFTSSRATNKSLFALQCLSKILQNAP